MTILSTRDIQCSLGRFSAGHNSCAFLNTVWRHYSVSIYVVTFLQPADHFRLARAQIVILVDRAEVALCATALVLGFNSVLSSFTVPTPPLQVWSRRSSSNGGDLFIADGSEAEMGGTTGTM